MLAKQKNSTQALHQLLVLEERVRQNDARLPAEVDLRVKAPRVRCKISELNLMIRMEDVVEVLDLNSLTVIPGCDSWVKGVCNLRGRLLPVYEIRDYFSDAINVSERSKNMQIAVVDSGGIFCGIIVDKIFGMQRFYEDEFVEFEQAKSPGMGGISNFVNATIRLENTNWHQVDLVMLAKKLNESNPSNSMKNVQGE